MTKVLIAASALVFSVGGAMACPYSNTTASVDRETTVASIADSSTAQQSTPVRAEEK